MTPIINQQPFHASHGLDPFVLRHRAGQLRSKYLLFLARRLRRLVRERIRDPGYEGKSVELRDEHYLVGRSSG